MSAIKARLEAQIACVQAFRSGEVDQVDINDVLTAAEGTLSKLKQQQSNAHKTLQELMRAINSIDPHSVMISHIKESQRVSKALQEENDRLRGELGEKQVALESNQRHNSRLTQRLKAIQEQAANAGAACSLGERLLCSAAELSFNVP